MIHSENVSQQSPTVWQWNSINAWYHTYSPNVPRSGFFVWAKPNSGKNMYTGLVGMPKHKNENILT